jgi:sulfite reductase beta subunit-like hemoprotein
VVSPHIQGYGRDRAVPYDLTMEVLAGMAGAVAVVATTAAAVQATIRFNWEFRDRRIKKQDESKPLIETFTLAEMREEVRRILPPPNGPAAEVDKVPRGRSWRASRVAAGAWAIVLLARYGRSGPVRLITLGTVAALTLRVLVGGCRVPVATDAPQPSRPNGVEAPG